MSNGTKETASRHVQLLSYMRTSLNSSADDLLPWDLKKLDTCTVALWAALPLPCTSTILQRLEVDWRSLHGRKRAQPGQASTDVTDLATRAAVYSGSKRSECAHLGGRMVRRRRWLTALKRSQARRAGEQILWRFAARGPCFHKAQGFGPPHKVQAAVNIGN